MNIGAIITGDIIDSSKLSIEERDSMLGYLRAIPDILSPIQPVRIEIFRGDSFQIGILHPTESLRIAIAIRAYLRSHRMKESHILLDARIALGIGSIHYESETLSTSDGEAFRNAGYLLDHMGSARLEILTPWDEVNQEIKLATSFADNIISSWTSSQSKIELAALLDDRSHYDIAKVLSISRQMVDKSLRTSKADLIRTYIERFKQLLTTHINEK